MTIKLQLLLQKLKLLLQKLRLLLQKLQLLLQKLRLLLQLTQQRKESQLKLPMRLQSSQRLPQLLQLLVPKTQRLKVPHQRNQQFQLMFILPKMLLSETILLMLSLLQKLALVPKPSELTQNTSQPQSIQLKLEHGKKLISLKSLLTQRPLLPQLLPLLLQLQKDHLMLILLKMLLLETTPLMLSPPKKLRLVFKQSEPNQPMLQPQSTQLSPPPGKKLDSLKNNENSVK